MNPLKKFRVWDNKNKEFVKALDFINHLWQSNKQTKEVILDNGAQEDYIVCMFTGLTDKNGREIYEGDIVEDEGAKMEIVWDRERLAFREKNDVMNCPIEFTDKFKTIFKVIGNIYENPELL